MTGSPGLALALIALAPSLNSSWNRSLLLLSRTIRRLILLPLSTSTHISDALCVLHLSSNGQGCLDHRVPSSHVCRRMMCLKPLEVTRPSLAHRCTSPCSGTSHGAHLHNNGNCSPYSLYKGMWVKHRWWLTIFPWTTSMSAPSTCRLHNLGSLTIITYSTIYTIVQKNFIKILLYKTLLQKLYSRPHDSCHSRLS